MSWLSLSDKGKWCPTDLNAFCVSIINICCWVMSELNASDITSQPCKMQHSVETWTFPLARGDTRYGCGDEALKLHSSVLDQQRNSAQLFPLHITINLNTATLEEYRTDVAKCPNFFYLVTWYLNTCVNFGCGFYTFVTCLTQPSCTSSIAQLLFDNCVLQTLSPWLIWAECTRWSQRMQPQ